MISRDEWVRLAREIRVTWPGAPFGENVSDAWWRYLGHYEARDVLAAIEALARDPMQTGLPHVAAIAEDARRLARARTPYAPPDPALPAPPAPEAEGNLRADVDAVCSALRSTLADDEEPGGAESVLRWRVPAYGLVARFGRSRVLAVIEAARSHPAWGTAIRDMADVDTHWPHLVMAHAGTCKRGGDE